MDTTRTTVVMHPTLKKFVEHWQGLNRPPGQAPYFVDFDIKALSGDTMKNLVLVKVEGEPPDRRFQYRIVGGQISKSYGEDFTGKYLDEVNLGDRAEIFRRSYEDIIRSRNWLHTRYEIEREDGPSYRYGCLWMPFANSQRQISHIVLVILPDV